MNEAQRAAYGRLCGFVDAVFKPIRVCARGTELEDIDRIRDGFKRKYGEECLSATDSETLNANVSRAINAIRAVDLLSDGFFPGDLLRGSDIGDQYSRRFRDALRRCVYPRQLVEDRIAKAKALADTDEHGQLFADYPDCEWAEYVEVDDPEEFLKEEVKWLNKLLPELTSSTDSFYGAPPHITSLDRELDQHRKACALHLKEWQRAQAITDIAQRQAAIKACQYTCRSDLPRTGALLRARLRTYLGVS